MTGVLGFTVIMILYEPVMFCEWLRFFFVTVIDPYRYIFDTCDPYLLKFNAIISTRACILLENPCIGLLLYSLACLYICTYCQLFVCKVTASNIIVVVDVNLFMDCYFNTE